MPRASKPLRFVAFLRAVNVGGRIVKMTELKRLFERAGLDEVSTFIASGNVIFQSTRSPATLEPHIEAVLQKGLGYAVPTMIRTAAEVRAIAEREVYTPRFTGDAPIYVGMIRGSPSAAAVQKALALQTEVDQLQIVGREVYWLARNRIAEATITGAAVEKALQVPLTFRSLNTMRRLALKYYADSDR